MGQGMKQAMKQTQRDYSLTFKLALIEQIGKGGLTSGALWHAGLTQAREVVREAVDIYKVERQHQALKYRPPDVVHRGG
ncbi:hypothetical protein [Aeromonas jandaei]|uniref:hypothetical protein n=1 Tax=Aeromonas jandaei TaxID=650 RepID=UPI00366F6AA7